MTGLAVIGASLGCYLLKFGGLAAPGALVQRPVVRRVVDLVPAALLAALVAVQAFTDGRSLTVDARVAGLVAAVAALLLRAPFLVVLLVAGGTAAIVHALA